MRNITIAILALTLLGPAPSFAQFESAEESLQIAMGGRRGMAFRGARGKKFGFGRRGRGGLRRGHRASRHYHYYPREYYYPRAYYPKTFLRNHGFYPRQDRSFYPFQGGSDYREWFDLPRR